jgi:hypothetical protein
MILALAFLAGCTTKPQVLPAQYQANPEVNFDAYKTFALLPLPEDLPGARDDALLVYGNTAQDGMREALLAKGYTESPVETADFAIGLKGTVVPTINVQQHGFNYGFYSLSSFWGSNYPGMTFGVVQDMEMDAQNYVILVLEIFDGQSKEMSWVGWMIGSKDNKPVEHEVVKARISEILANFPTGTGQ